MNSGDRGGAGSGLFAGITGNVFVAGLVSLLTDISSEMIYPILPLFIVNVLHGSPATVGLIEGIGEATASLVKVISGWLSDRAGRRKPLMVAGYSLSDLSKPLLAVTAYWPEVLGIRFADRFGKGIRGAPRDALIADSTAIGMLGKAFGFHRAMDTLGAAIGPLSAFAILAFFAGNYRLVFAIAALPGVAAIVVLVLGLRDKPVPAQPTAALRLSFAALGRPFLLFVAIATLFAIGNSSDAFLLLRAQNIGLAVSLVPLAYFGFNIVYTLLAMPVGSFSDRVGRPAVITVGYFVFAAVYGGFALANQSWLVWPLFAAYGIYYALTDGMQRAYVADLVPAERRASAIGAFNAVTGAAALPASLAAGFLWQQVGPSATFYFGAAFALLAAILFLLLIPRRAG